jgi:hypothetical protein
LQVTRQQAEQWLRRLVAEGVLDKRTKPVRYVIRRVDLFRAETSDTTGPPNNEAEFRT